MTGDSGTGDWEEIERRLSDECQNPTFITTLALWEPLH
jgi:hypothetical protein